MDQFKSIERNLNIVGLLGALLLAIAISLLIYSTGMDTRNTAPHAPVRPCFAFPDGWELASHSRHAANVLGGPYYYVYVCRNIESGVYQQCTPELVECE